jgi:hypothetical protein
MQTWSTTITTLLPPQATNKIEEEGLLSIMEVKEEGALYSPPYLSTREW